MSNIVVVFSGGFDSSLVFAQAMKECNDSKEFDGVTLVTVVNKLTGEPKLVRENKSRVQVQAYLESLYPTIPVDTYQIELNTPYTSIFGNISTKYNKGLAQPIFWVNSIMPMINSDDVVRFGYLKGDDAMVHHHEITQMMELGTKIQNGKSVKVEFPLRQLGKFDVLLRIMADYPAIMDLAISCEGMEYINNPCSKCTPCRHIKSALVEIAVSDLDRSYIDKATFYLEKFFKLRFTLESTIISENKDEEVLIDTGEQLSLINDDEVE